jgi:DHA1 family multidrug resistance protein-like MFS transporter
MFFAQMMTAVGFSSIFPFLPLCVESLGSSTDLSVEFLAGLVYSAQAFTMMLASPIWGGLADRYGRKIMVERAMLGGAVILLLMAHVQTAEQLVALRAVQGFITGTLADAFGYRVPFFVTSALLLVSGLLVATGVKENFIRPELAKDLRLSLMAEWW